MTQTIKIYDLIHGQNFGHFYKFKLILKFGGHNLKLL